MEKATVLGAVWLIFCLLQVTGFGPENDGLKKALEGSEIVVIPAGVPRKPVSILTLN